MLKGKKQRFKLNTRLRSLAEQRTPDRETRSAVNTRRKDGCTQPHFQQATQKSYYR